MESIYVGQVVCLKSGGAPMTVTEIRGDGVATLEWTDNNNCAQCITAHKECVFLLTGQP